MKKKPFTDIQKTRLIALHVLEEEKLKKRDVGANGKPEFSELSKSFANGITHIETEIDKLITRLKRGETIYEILPKLINEEENLEQ